LYWKVTTAKQTFKKHTKNNYQSLLMRLLFEIKVLFTLWSSNGNPTGSISIQVNTHSEQPYIELNYKYRDEPRNYKLSLVSMLSNLGKGLIWYFLCPQTNRQLDKTLGAYLKEDELYSQLYQKHFKKTYAGKPTKKYLRIIEHIQKAEN
jgi:hypothetical protein